LILYGFEFPLPALGMFLVVMFVLALVARR
jgi:hypothetical protein